MCAYDSGGPSCEGGCDGSPWGQPVLLALGTWANAGWANTLVTGYTAPRTDPLPRSGRESFGRVLPSPAPPVPPARTG